MNTQRAMSIWILTAMTVIAFALPPAASAQPGGKTPGGADNAPHVFDLDFPGGSLDAFLDAVRSAHPEANIVAPPEASDFPIPPMKLRNITLQAAMQLIEGSAELPSGHEAHIGVEGFPVFDSWDPAIRVDHSGSRQSRWGEQQSSVWSLAEHLTGGRASEDVLGAVQVALATFPVESTIRFHEPTSLLIVRGTEAQLELVDKTLAQLRGDVRRQSGEAELLRHEISTLESELIESQARLRVAQKRADVARSEFAAKAKAGKDQIESGAASAVDVEGWLGEAELKLVEAEADLEITQNKARQIAMRLEAVRKRLDELAADAK